MNQREAMERGMAAIEDRKRVAITRAKAKPSVAASSPDELKADAVADAEAWNLLRHLSRIL